MLNYFFLFMIALFFSWIFCFCFEYIAKSFHIVTKYEKVLASRQNPVALLGGGPLYFAFVLTLLIFFYLNLKSPTLHMEIEFRKLLGILISAALFSLAGLIYDIYPYPKTVKLSAQIVAAFMLVMFSSKTELAVLNVIPLTIYSSSGDQVFYLGNIIFSLLWILAITAILESCDFLNGFVIGIASIISLFIFAICTFTYQYTNALFAIILAGAFCALFIRQTSSQKIILGSMGSGFIGITLSAITLETQYSSNNSLGFVTPLFLFVVPILCGVTLFYFWIRKEKKQSQNFFVTWVAKGVSEKNLLFFAMAITSIFSMLGFALVITKSLGIIYAIVILSFAIFISLQLAIIYSLKKKL